MELYCYTKDQDGNLRQMNKRGGSRFCVDGSNECVDVRWSAKEERKRISHQQTEEEQEGCLPCKVFSIDFLTEEIMHKVDRRLELCHGFNMIASVEDELDRLKESNESLSAMNDALRQENTALRELAGLIEHNDEKVKNSMQKKVSITETVKRKETRVQGRGGSSIANGRGSSGRGTRGRGGRRRNSRGRGVRGRGGRGRGGRGRGMQRENTWPKLKGIFRRPTGSRGRGSDWGRGRGTDRGRGRGRRRGRGQNARVQFQKTATVA